jgi:hypothetical protein
LKTVRLGPFFRESFEVGGLRSGHRGVPGDQSSSSFSVLEFGADRSTLRPPCGRSTLLFVITQLPGESFLDCSVNKRPSRRRVPATGRRPLARPEMWSRKRSADVQQVRVRVAQLDRAFRRFDKSQAILRRSTVSSARVRRSSSDCEISLIFSSIRSGRDRRGLRGGPLCAFCSGLHHCGRNGVEECRSFSLAKARDRMEKEADAGTGSRMEER